VTSAVWSDNAAPVNTAAGRIYFEMPSNKRLTRWTGYVCSGTVVTDGTTGRSTILTAAHCVYDDTNKAFARNVMFIPDQDETTSGKTDLTCSNDPYGCWVPNFGVVDVNWTTRTFPDNVHWDYAFYAVNDTGAHQAGFTPGVSDVLDSAVSSLAIDYGSQSLVKTWAIGYSYADDPNLMYCTDPLTSLNADNYFLTNCGLTGGSSGGPWMQTAGSGPIMSLNSWGYTTGPGMAGPKFYNNTTSCVFAKAKSGAFMANPADGTAGYTTNGTGCP
jgi:hypothetical protein